MKFFVKDLSSKCNQISSFCSFLRIWSHLLKKSLMENFIFCAVLYMRVVFARENIFNYERWSNRSGYFWYQDNIFAKFFLKKYLNKLTVANFWLRGGVAIRVYFDLSWLDVSVGSCWANFWQFLKKHFINVRPVS